MSRNTTTHCSTSTQVADFANHLDTGPEYISEGGRADEKNCFDMELYQPAKKLQIARQDLRNIILRPGELHIVMADLCTISAFIDNSGLDMCWLESELYSPATVKQILEGGHVKRAETAHMVTLQALFTLY